MNRRVLMSLLLVISVSTMASGLSDISPEVIGRAVCANADWGACKIVWSFHPEGRAFYWLEQFDPGSENWHRVAGPTNDPSAISPEPATPGFLYRAVACADSAGTDGCRGSTVLWVPVKPADANEIPEIVEAAGGPLSTMAVSKNLSLMEQTQQYNVYLMVALTSDLDQMPSMPPMTLPLVDPFAAWASEEAILDTLVAAKPTPDQLIHFVVYKEYEGARRQLAPLLE